FAALRVFHPFPTRRSSDLGAVLDMDWFFQMVPVILRVPMVMLASAATVIASQAVITGAFSLTNQAMQLGLLPRMVVKRTSATQRSEEHTYELQSPCNIVCR